MALSDKHCVPCEGGMPPLGADKVSALMRELKDKWQIKDGKKIQRTFVFKDFMDAMNFVNKVAELAESEGHHPDVIIHWNKVTLELSTHAVGGLSENDFILAAKLEPLANHKRHITHEHGRDLLKLAGVRTEASFVDVLSAKVSRLVEWRTPWLLAGLFGGILAGALVKSFQQNLEEVIELAFFMPAMVYMGSAVGQQTQMLFIRGLLTGHVRIARYLRRETLVDLIIALISSLILAFFVYFTTESPVVATIIGTALFVIIATAGWIAILVSLLLVKFHRDPAIGGGPFTTIIQDLASLFIYFAVASAFLL